MFSRYVSKCLPEGTDNTETFLYVIYKDIFSFNTYHIFFTEFSDFLVKCIHMVFKPKVHSVGFSGAGRHVIYYLKLCF